MQVEYDKLLPALKLRMQAPPRFHFRLDGMHPKGASHHQKMVVVDDAVAFVGGIDLSRWRWDTPSHQPDDPRRIDPDGRPYPPFHDMMMMVEGEVAERLGELARERWRRIGSVPEKARSSLEKHFGEVLERLESHLGKERERELQRRRALIRKVEQLASAPDTRTEWNASHAGRHPTHHPH